MKGTTESREAGPTAKVEKGGNEEWEKNLSLVFGAIGEMAGGGKDGGRE